ncbi:hypothetical protein ACFFVK_18910 [Flavobacterium gyeonganense]|uniref:Uncharacterized protein n=1 Tax=Flavobacterium gyeonganense TaxID=1310418 RepID=A0ABV5HFH7_9FLAO
MKKHLIILFLIIDALTYGQINTTKGDCEIIKIDDIRSFPGSNDLVLYYYSFDGLNWNLFNHTQEQYREGLIFTVKDDIRGFISVDDDSVSPYVGPLYIKGEALTNVGSHPNPNLLVDNCEKQIAQTPPNKPIPCNFRRIGIPTQYYYIIPCSPHLASVPITSKSTCFENHDAKVTFLFDRDLQTNEYFLLNLMTITANSTPVPPQVKYVYKDNYIDRKISFTGLDSGTFYLRYQTFQEGNPTPFSDNNSDHFTIDAVMPLTFNVRAYNPKCNNDKVDLTIEADGGTPPYFYNNLNGETEIINGVTQVKKIQFDPSDKNKKTVTIQQAELKEYNIKVTDSNNCIEQ